MDVQAVEHAIHHSALASVDSKHDSSGKSMSVLKRFIAVRGLMEEVQRSQGNEPVSSQLTAEMLSQNYTRQRFGKKSRAQRDALAFSSNDYENSVDTNRTIKRRQEFVNIHKDEQEVNDAYYKEIRTLMYKRESLDKPVCDLMKNRLEYQERLRALTKRA
ncbi:uncharacterized protein PHALS_02414 [Plasmopara halstedii]|uniref:Uncharacterized protein n=1 Tax=Plasmopara halstedii TaxID=4781 RepID=A0A0P1A7W4_PLAHL|nr:uncharacterized protein PHALS_02414 [Plasmopara halstedii]CEG36324.1 hypothetical protein PHALS_02414 [Plasmopara halstedii]|eukprot:XP_024572693.1 hypothetical protein PHALS_02414 [Plasmopara halstedii]